MNYDYKNFSILYGEDDPDDIRIFDSLLKGLEYNGHYKQLALGQQVIDWTLKKGEFRGSVHPGPQLIILDIGLLGLDGKEVLEILRDNEISGTIPILIISGSSSIREFHECIRLGCNGYIQKSVDPDNFSRTCQLFIEGWARLSRQDFF